MSHREGPPDSELLAAGALGFAVGALLGWAASGRRGRRGRELRQFLDELIGAARDGLLSSAKGGPGMDRAVRRLRALGERIRDEATD